MGLQYSSAVWKDRTYKGAARIVLLCLAEHANDAGVAWPSVELIAEETQLTKRAVFMAISNLEKAGAVIISHARYYNNYAIQLENGNLVNVVHANDELRSLNDELRSPNDELRSLNDELRSPNDELRSLNDELRSPNDELRSLNDELRSPNDELRSLNDELRSPNDELRSLNDELRSPNDELRSLNDELRSPNDELRSLNDELRSPKPSLTVIEPSLEPSTAAEENPAAAAVIDASQIYTDDLMRIFVEVTSMVAIPGGANDAERIIGILQSLKDIHGNATVDYLRPFWNAFITGRAKTGKAYSRSKLFWLTDWAVSGEIPDYVTKASTVVEYTPEELTEIRRGMGLIA